MIWVTTVVGEGAAAVVGACTYDVEGSSVTTDVEGAKVVVVEAMTDVPASAVVVGVATSLVVGIDVSAVVVEVKAAAVDVVTNHLLESDGARLATANLPDDMVTSCRSPVNFSGYPDASICSSRYESMKQNLNIL